MAKIPSLSTSPYPKTDTRKKEFSVKNIISFLDVFYVKDCLKFWYSNVVGRSWNNPKQISPKLNRHEMKWSRSVRGGSMNLACLSPSKYCQFHQHQCLPHQRTRHRRTQCRRQCLPHRTKRSRWSWQFQGTHRKTSSFLPRQQSTSEWRQLGHPKKMKTIIIIN